MLGLQPLKNLFQQTVRLTPPSAARSSGQSIFPPDCGRSYAGREGPGDGLVQPDSGLGLGQWLSVVEIG